VKSVRRIRRVFGKVHVNFGEPLALAGFLDAHHPRWYARARRRKRCGRARRHATAAAELAKRINEAAVLNPINLLALALLATEKHTADEDALQRLIEHYQALAEQAPYAPTSIPCALDPREIIAYGERLTVVERFADPLGDLIRVREGQARYSPIFVTTCSTSLPCQR
jgi:glycerol-3-phosphate O-acyltransferase